MFKGIKRQWDKGDGRSRFLPIPKIELGKPGELTREGNVKRVGRKKRKERKKKKKNKPPKSKRR